MTGTTQYEADDGTGWWRCTWAEHHVGDLTRRPCPGCVSMNRGDVAPGPQDGLGGDSGPTVDEGAGQRETATQPRFCWDPKMRILITHAEDDVRVIENVSGHDVKQTVELIPADRVEDVLAYLDRCETDDWANFTTVEVRRLLTQDSS